MRFNAPILIAWMLRQRCTGTNPLPSFAFFPCISPVLMTTLASALYHGGVAWLVPNLTAGTVDTEAGADVQKDRSSDDASAPGR